MNEQDIYNALKEAYRRAKTQAALAKKAHLSQGRIADYLNKRYCIGNMTCSTLLRLFPEMQVSFFSDDGLSVSDRSDQSEESDNRVCQDSLRRALQNAEAKKTEYEHKVKELAREKADLENARKYLELEKENIETARNLLEQEKENWRLKRELENAKNDVAARLFKR